MSGAARPTVFTLLFAVSVFLLSSCLGPHKIDKWVAKKYDGSLPAPSRKKADYLTVTSPVTPASGEHLSTTTKRTSNVLPLLFYWQWDYKNTCMLNEKLPLNDFSSAVYGYANSKGLRQKLQGQTIELTVQKLPNTFAIDDKGHLIWVLLYAFGWDNLSIQPMDNELVVSYKVFENNAEAKKGVITVRNPDKGLQVKMFQSLKRKTWEYLDQYDAAITQMSKKVVDQLMAEL